MQLTFVTGAGKGGNLSKEIFKDPDTGEIDTRNYFLQFKLFNSHVEEVSTMAEFHSKLVKFADIGGAIIKGSYIKDLKNERRAGMTDRTKPTWWMCLDFDSVKYVGDSKTLLSNIGIHDVDHIMQYSATHGVKPGLRGHIFVMLNMPMEEAAMKQWFMYMNLTNNFLSPNIRLQPAGRALGWPLDVSLAEMHRIIYIAPPTFSGAQDPFAKGGEFEGQDRIHYVKGTNPTFDIRAAMDVADFGVIGPMQEQKIQELRGERGLRRSQTPKLKHDKRNNIYVMPNPEEAYVTSVKTERGFVYLNLNGGDSWGYYHPEGNFEVIQNFKGEPAYKTSELLPEYYTQCISDQRTAARASMDGDNPTGTQHFYFTEKRSGAYYKGTSVPEKGVRDLDPAKSRQQIQDFCMQYNLPDPTFVPIYDTIFDPDQDFFFDSKRGQVNIYEPTEYRRNRDPSKAPTTVPPTIRQVIKHALGGSDEAFVRFIHWVAWIWQTSTKPETAWVLHGVQGTGKGTTINSILGPIFGLKQAFEMQVEPLAEKFNGWIRQAQIIMFDESDTDSMKGNLSAIAAKLKHIITEPNIMIREMNKDMYVEPTRCGIIISSNKGNPALVDYGDRRYNVAPRQEVQLLDVMTRGQLREGLPPELQDFANYLTALEVDQEIVKTPWDNESKHVVQGSTTSTPDEIIRNLVLGNFDYFAELLPMGIAGNAANAMDNANAYSFRTVLAELRTKMEKASGTARRTFTYPLQRDEIYVIFEFAAGWKMTSAKFTKTLSKFGVVLKKVRKHDIQRPGLNISWHYNNDSVDLFDAATLDPLQGRIER